MASHSSPEGRQNSGDKVFRGLPAKPGEEDRFRTFLDSHDFAENTRRAIAQDVRKFAAWFVESNREPFSVERVTTRDVVDFRNAMRRERRQAIATVNRSLVTVRRYFAWLGERGEIESNPAKRVKELRKVELAPKGLDRAVVRKLLREVELRNDFRANALFHLLLYTGCRCGDVVQLQRSDVVIGDRSGSVVFRNGKGNKQRSVPLPAPARSALVAYLERRPPVQSPALLIGERGPLGERGLRALCDKYSALIGVKIHPHLLRHTMAHRYLDANPGDLAGLAQILGHESLDTTKRYVLKSEQDLREASDRIEF